ncbi:hypothetical protein A3K34_03875 [candidate division WWE3 bacterium RIFOXYC1_FULL_40_10]|uniref:Gcp-like domain-containing protein n=1 Tax=candidate division WWE3 bacterium RIFOXYA2_FULL_46_9 TaxID=1802636 RepID=A0A1F4W0C8_UNCKA|nr:MAG: hypothetical protein A3K58_03875 [candidate division WWE3 bacterium RIFOXYB1_FULL_40_22]OGC61979.1 MAG: hypothetical protein A3K37_03875 [candidate division WWE3 bacterium RIFOXYA1_FULL_40_11]OGC62897.1 MAG: hypothetical protein A2264_03395 [candidate division WWE3 bacterium RIFOXYA2_FULL_46_9]OGC65077.1 MAG: hypothetical protein A2326_03500 [candidate division WWE3 bacterium RIFOXYB2_FULL_41_6]OGC66362.1 MAG: hypothetical protein A3K34_03875 [candidate division WWE3 bacterium RIFOXYC1_
MYKIYINTTNRKDKSVRLEKDGKLVDEISGEIDVSSEIGNMLEKYQIRPGEVEEIIPKQGPGSFTGLKAGFTLANVYNWAVGHKTAEELDYPDYGGDPNITPPKN